MGFGATGGNGFVNTSTTLRRAMVKLPTMKIMVASGYYDLATPFAGADFTVNQLPLSRELRQNFVHAYYEGGHMFYLNPAAHEAFKRDVAEFFKRALNK